jgi:thiamine kinase-like enzyme
MKKLIGASLFLLFIVLFLAFLGPLQVLRRNGAPGDKRWEPRIVLTQETEKEEGDPHFMLILKKVQEVLDGWLKSLNERIENEDVTRLEVRFLEVLRSILEWVKEKVDAKLESYREEGPKKERGLFRDTHHRGAIFSRTG